jgi:predicted enzyme related to lactoylglutathione lyase
MTHINLIVIKTDKLEKQFEFYSTLGIQFDYHKHGHGPYHYASITGNPTIEIYPLPKSILQSDNTTRLGFSIENLDLLIQKLKAQGVTIVSEPFQSEWGYAAVIQDMDGRKIDLTETKASG